MSDIDPPPLDSEVAIQRAELQLKKEEFEHKKNTGAKSWRSAILVPVAIVSITGLLNILNVRSSAMKERDLANTIVRVEGENQLFEREHALIISAMGLEEPKRAEALCELRYSNYFLHEKSKTVLFNAVSSDPNCTSSGYQSTKDKNNPSTTPPTNSQRLTAAQCKSLATTVTSSCRAYDKSGFHSRPSANCSMRLSAGSGRFFAKDKVIVVSEYYRKLKGDKASVAMKPSSSKGAVRTFSGKIACTNSKGTGRTCEAKATVRAISYPDKCLPLKTKL